MFKCIVVNTAYVLSHLLLKLEHKKKTEDKWAQQLQRTRQTEQKKRDECAKKCGRPECRRNCERTTRCAEDGETLRPQERGNKSVDVRDVCGAEAVAQSGCRQQRMCPKTHRGGGFCFCSLTVKI